MLLNIPPVIRMFSETECFWLVKEGGELEGISTGGVMNSKHKLYNYHISILIFMLCAALSVTQCFIFIFCPV